jgi:hypothetical protein
MNAQMFGTDLSSAYSEPDNMDLNNFDFDKKVTNIDYNSEFDRQPLEQKNEINQNQPNNQDQSSKRISAAYNQSEIFQDMNETNLRSQMASLKNEINNQKKINQIQYKESFERKSIIDRVFSKKREMIRFISISLIIIFALSMHQTFNEFLKDYVSNTDLSRNKEAMVRLSYPLGIFIAAWLLKVMVR